MPLKFAWIKMGQLFRKKVKILFKLYYEKSKIPVILAYRSFINFISIILHFFPYTLCYYCQIYYIYSLQSQQYSIIIIDLNRIAVLKKLRE